MAKTWIDTSETSKSFKSKLTEEDNKRIIFSGIFGIGKTTFLKNFFKKNEEYIALHLFPVNYSVATNEDIFELIKYDILYQILSHKPQLKSLEVSNIDVLPYLDWNDTYKILKSFIQAIPIINKSVPKILSAIEYLLKILESKKEEFTKGNEPELISTFATSIENKIGGIYERDLYTSLINVLIAQLKSEETKKVVLIIDDVDRIDPEHIFRILNVFAAHFDSPEHEQSENKFGIDKVILSCDINNIRSIFHYRHGIDTDFSGYIDKFISKEVFYFDIRSSISLCVNKILMSIKNESIKINYSILNYQISTFLISMAVSGSLNLRSLFKLEEKGYNFQSYNLQFPSRILSIENISLFKTFDFIISLTGGIENARQAFMASNFVFAKTEQTSWDRLLGDLILISDHQHNKLSQGSFFFDLNGKRIQYGVAIGFPSTVTIAGFDKDPSFLNATFQINKLIITAFDEFVKYRNNRL